MKPPHRYAVRPTSKEKREAKISELEALLVQFDYWYRIVIPPYIRCQSPQGRQTIIPGSRLCLPYLSQSPDVTITIKLCIPVEVHNSRYSESGYSKNHGPAKETVVTKGVIETEAVDGLRF